MNQKVIIESLSMDLLRTALGLHRGSLKMAERFKIEAWKRQEELESQPIKNPYLKDLLNKSKTLLSSNRKDMADDFLMYSILFQNFIKKYLS